MGPFRIVLCIIPAILLVSSKQLVKAVGYVAIFSAFFGYSDLCFTKPYRYIEFPCTIHNRVLLSYSSQHRNRYLRSKDNDC